ncbi:MAG: hypothetical protein FD124_1218, partial [Alphaproteobacteria bacterium]
MIRTITAALAGVCVMAGLALGGFAFADGPGPGPPPAPPKGTARPAAVPQGAVVQPDGSTV